MKNTLSLPNCGELSRMARAMPVVEGGAAAGVYQHARHDLDHGGLVAVAAERQAGAAAVAAECHPAAGVRATPAIGALGGTARGVAERGPGNAAESLVEQHG